MNTVQVSARATAAIAEVLCAISSGGAARPEGTICRVDVPLPRFWEGWILTWENSRLLNKGLATDLGAIALQSFIDLRRFAPTGRGFVVN